jgi:hypothetical protein
MVWMWEPTVIVLLAGFQSLVGCIFACPSLSYIWVLNVQVTICFYLFFAHIGKGGMCQHFIHYVNKSRGLLYNIPIRNHSDACTFSCSTIMVFKASVKRRLGVKASPGRQSVRAGPTRNHISLRPKNREYPKKRLPHKKTPIPSSSAASLHHPPRRSLLDRHSSRDSSRSARSPAADHQRSPTHSPESLDDAASR